MLTQIVRKCRNPTNIFLSEIRKQCNKKFDECEEDGPSIKTNIPGPKSLDLIRKLKQFQNVGNIELFADYRNSINNYLADVDGNKLLDLNMQQGTIPLGYNNFELMNCVNQQGLFTNPICTHIFPCHCWEDKIRHVMKKISPQLPRITTVSSPSSANEYAFKAMMMAYKRNVRCDQKITDKELECAQVNRPPGSSFFSILSFKNGYHGETLGALSATRCKILSKLDVTAFDWPMANFPNYRYPLKDHCCFNCNQDRKCLAMVEELIESWKKRGQDVVGIVVEPIQGDNVTVASNDFFQGLQNCARKHNIFLMFDESQTGCGSTGKFWGHENFSLDCPPDAVSFSRKTLISGYLHTEELSPENRTRLTSIWMGDPARLAMFEAVIKTIEKHNLLNNVKETGDFLKCGIQKLEEEFEGLINSTRGLGTFLAFDAQCPSLRNDILCRLRQKGVLCGRCGSCGISLRPALTFTETHADIFLDKLRCVLKQTEVTEPPEIRHCTFPTLKTRHKPSKKENKKTCEQSMEEARKAPIEEPNGKTCEEMKLGSDKKDDPCENGKAKKEDPCKKMPPPCGSSGGDNKKEDACKKKEDDPGKKKEDPCKKKEDKKKEDPCKKMPQPCTTKDPCSSKKIEHVSDPPCSPTCNSHKKDDCMKEDPCKKKKEDPCMKKDEKKKEDPCKKMPQPCTTKDPCSGSVDTKQVNHVSNPPCSSPCSSWYKKDDDCAKEDPCKKKKDDPCKKKEEDPCKKKNKDPCKKREDPCKKKEDPCKTKEEESKKEDPCSGGGGGGKKVEYISVPPCPSPCSSWFKDEDPCKKKEDDPCKKENDDPCKKKKDDPCEKKEEDPCKEAEETKKEDSCKKVEYVSDPPCPAPCASWYKKDDCVKEDPCKKEEEDPCQKKEEDPCKKKEDPCKKKEETKKEDPCKKMPPPCGGSGGDNKKEDPCKKKEDTKKEDPCKKMPPPCSMGDFCGNSKQREDSCTPTKVVKAPKKKCDGKNLEPLTIGDPSDKKEDLSILRCNASTGKPCGGGRRDPCRKEERGKCEKKQPCRDLCKKKSPCTKKNTAPNRYFDELRDRGREAYKKIKERMKKAREMADAKN